MPSRLGSTVATTSWVWTGRSSAVPCVPSRRNESTRPPASCARSARTPRASGTARAASRDSSGATKLAIASIRSRLANHRVILGVAHFDATTKGGEGRVFTRLALDLAQRSGGIHGFTADGAWRGTHLNEIQTITGCGVIAPARRRPCREGGILIEGHGFAAQPLPWSRRRAQREAACGGHQLWAAAGTIFEQVINVDGGSEYRGSPHATRPNAIRLDTRAERSGTSSTAATPCPAPGILTTCGGSRSSPPMRTRRSGSIAPSTCASLRRPAPITAASTACARTPRASTPSSSAPSTASAFRPGRPQPNRRRPARHVGRQRLVPEGLAR